MMKKTYINPETTLNTVEVPQIIAESLGINGDKTAGIENGGFVREERGDWGIWDDDFNIDE